MSETYVITFQARTGKRERFLALLVPVLDAMKHEATFERASLHVDPEDANRFSFMKPGKTVGTCWKCRYTARIERHGTPLSMKSWNARVKSRYGHCCALTDRV